MNDDELFLFMAILILTLIFFGIGVALYEWIGPAGLFLYCLVLTLIMYHTK